MFTYPVSCMSSSPSSGSGRPTVHTSQHGHIVGVYTVCINFHFQFTQGVEERKSLR